ncbi:hypothetical protein T05_4889 [Trichinella murrelli]|uniref:Uncharacterized protein n=1 Tax=Trichinella murrelli TaxID=144512 RepID=A0A0V0UEI2_9BILA|nr:hypothetical protein T05_4889 [Trichinella murrelli]
MTSSMFRLNDVVIDRNDVHPTLSISVWSKMPFMSSSGHVFSSSPSHLVPSHHTMFARSRLQQLGDSLNLFYSVGYKQLPPSFIFDHPCEPDGGRPSILMPSQMRPRRRIHLSCHCLPYEPEYRPDPKMFQTLPDSLEPRSIVHSSGRPTGSYPKLTWTVFSIPSNALLIDQLRLSSRINRTAGFGFGRSLYTVSLLLSCFEAARLPTPLFLINRTNGSQ